MYLKHIVILFILASSLVITSCLTGDEQEDTPSQFAVNFQLDNVNDAQRVGEDTLQIQEIGFIQGRVALNASAGDSTVLYSADQVGVFRHQFPNQGFYPGILSGQLNPGVYVTLQYNIKTADADDENTPAVFIDEETDELYSLVISGILNGTEFIYKSAQPFNYDYSLSSPVEVSEYNTSVSFGISFDVHEFFVNADSTGLLDPTNPNNAGQINANIEEAIELLPFN